MPNDLLEKLADKSLTKEDLFKIVENNFELLPDIVDGMNSSKASIRYGCGKVLINLSEKYPEEIYPHMSFFINLLDSKYRILIWQAMAIIANLTKVDDEKIFDSTFDKYYSLINNDYMVTVANVVGNSGKIGLYKPYLVDRIVNQLLKVENIKTTPHLTDECKKVISEVVIKSFDMFFESVEDKKQIFDFVKKHTNSSRKTLKDSALKFLDKHQI